MVDTMIRQIDAKEIFPTRCEIGEGPFWHADSLWWVDIDHGMLYRGDVDTGEYRSWSVGERVGAVVPVAGSDDFLAACQSGLYRIVLKGDRLEREQLMDPEPDKPDNRFNDGKCDPRGRFWAGTMVLTKPRKEGDANFYRFDTDGTCTRMFGDVTVSNGLDWSPDEKRMYYIDTRYPHVSLFDYDVETGDISNRRVLLDGSELSGHPDGMTVDAEGCLWVAFWGGGAIRRFHPETGKMLAEVSVPAARSSSCCFGGSQLDKLFITTARSGMDEDEKHATPDAGAVFVCEPGVRGREVFSFNGNPADLHGSSTVERT